MASAAVLADFRRANNDVLELAFAELRDFWRSLDLGGNPVAVKVALEMFFPELVATYGEMTSLLAADFYDLLRLEKSLPKAFTATMADPVPAELARISARWASQPLFLEDPDWDGALARLVGATRKRVLQPGRDTIQANAHRDPVTAAWARVPSRSDACSFCRLIASRGAVYKTKESATIAKHGRKYHDSCYCTPVPVWDESLDLPESHNLSALQDEYSAAVEAAGTTDLASVLKHMRTPENPH